MAQLKGVIRSVSFDQHETLYNIMRLYNDGKPFDCDMTYSKGGFYGDFNITTIDGEKMHISIPRPHITFDVAPQDDETIKIEPDGLLPLADNSLGSIVFDPPFVISCGPSMNGPDYDEDGKRVKNNIISRRFSCYYPVKNLTESYQHWMSEISRVLKDDGIAVVKTQKTITGGKSLNSSDYLWLLGEMYNLDMVDTFLVIAKARLISGKVKAQQHSRRFESEFLVFKKSLRKKIRYFAHLQESELRHLFENVIANNLSKKIR